MKVRAVAVANERSNAVGSLELEPTPLGLVMVYRGVGAFAQGYVPAAPTTGTRVTVPWASILEARREGDRLWLALEPSLTPHHRLLLGAFSTGDPPDPAELSARRRLLQLASAGATLVLVLVASLSLPTLAPRAGAAGALALGGLVALAVLGVGFVARRRSNDSALDARATQLAFVAELTHYLPTLAVFEHRQTPPRAERPALGMETLLPRSTTAITITLTACMLGAVLIATRIVAPPASRSEVDTPHQGGQRGALAEDVDETLLAANPATGADDDPTRAPDRPSPVAPSPTRGSPSGASPVAAAGTAANAAATPAAALAPGAACRCARAASPLWQEPIPRVGTILIERKEDHRKKGIYLELELGLVNNSDTPIDEVNVLVRFMDRDPPPSKKTYYTVDRPLYFQGPLEPGQAIKWHVEGRGTDFEVVHGFEGDIGVDGEHAAPTNLLAALLQANHRPIRLHGAMLLAFLGDPRAKEGALALREALREDEEPYLDRVLRSLAEVRVCSLLVAEHGTDRSFSACVFNTAREPRDGLGLRLRALDRRFPRDTPTAHPPLVLATATQALAGPLPAGTGRVQSGRFDVTHPDGAVPASFEAFADRLDLLPP